MKSKRILILSASAGNGHVRAAEALARAFQMEAQNSGIPAEIRHIDALSKVSLPMRAVYSRAYIRMVNRAPSVLGWLYNHLDVPYKDEKRRLLVNRVNSLPLAKEIVTFNPDIIVCTHFLPADIASVLIKRHKIQSQLAVVVTDFDAHGMWLTRNVDRYYVALPETKEHLVSLGVPEAAVTVSGIPIDPVFVQKKNAKETTLTKTDLGLSDAAPTILISAGGMGVGPVQELLESIKDWQENHAAEANKTDNLAPGENREINIIALCGKNKELKEKLEEESKQWKHLNLHALGYVNNVQDYMALCDVVLGKPGGLTTCEALASGLAFIVFNPIPGQEERNSTHLLENGAAIRCNNLPTVGYKLQKLFSDPEKLAQLKLNAMAMSKPRAAQKIACQLLAGLCNSTVKLSA